MKDLISVINAQNKALEQIQADVSTSVLARITDLSDKQGLKLPDNYNAANALKSAQLILVQTKDRNGKSVLESCSMPSVTQALLDMCIQGLNPTLTQCYFVAHGSELTLMRSYFGTQLVAKRLDSRIDRIISVCVYKGEQLELGISDNGDYELKKHVPNVEAINNGEIIACYGYVLDKNGNKLATEFMTMNQIKQCWGMSPNKENNKFQKNFPDQAAKRTLINRMMKPFTNTNPDTDSVFIESVRRTAEVDDIVEQDAVIVDVEEPEEETTTKTVPNTDNTTKPEPKDDNLKSGDLEF